MLKVADVADKSVPEGRRIVILIYEIPGLPRPVFKRFFFCVFSGKTNNGKFKAPF